MAKKQEEIELDESVVQEGNDSIEQFVENNQNIILGALGLLVLLIIVFVGYKKLIVAPKENEASNLIYHAQNYFEKDSFNLALNGDGANYGFADIVDEFKVTRVGKTARYYAGICELHLGNYAEAVDYLSKFKTKDPVVQAVAYGSLGDANAQLDDMSAAIANYKKAANTATLKSVKTAYLYRAGKAYEATEDFKGAKSMYQQVVAIYPDANQQGIPPADQTIARNAQKSLARVAALAN